MPKQRQTCTECSMRRQKCDRNIPCGRCVKRGEPDRCTREWPKEGYDPKIHRTYPRTERDERDSPDSDNSSDSNEHHHSKRVPEGSRKSVSSVQSSTERLLPNRASRPDLERQKTDKGQDNVIDFITWGKTRLPDFKIDKVAVNKDVPNTSPDSSTEWNFSNGFGYSNSTQVAFLQMILPNQQQIEQLVDYHLSNILWTHGSIHAPTFRKELSDNSNRDHGIQIHNLDMRWVALLFAVIAGTMASAKEHVISTWGFMKTEKAKLTRQWFKAAISCLNLADYMWKHHIYSIQAITTLTMSGHLLGFSNTQSTLLSAAIKIGQSLGIQRLGPEEDDSTGEPNLNNLIRVETGRRIWHQLCIQDWFSIPFSDMYSIQHHHFTSLPPKNYDDETLKLLPDNIPTMTSYLQHLGTLGRLMTACHDEVIFRNTVFDKYETVIQYEAKINQWKAGLSPGLRMDEPLDPYWPKWALWMRRSLVICYNHKILMIHRNFLGRSFTEPCFARTRTSCIAAAKEILRDTTTSLESEAPVFWIDHAFTVAAGITLCLDIFHRQETDVEYDEHRKLVEKGIITLTKFEDSMIAARGIRLLSSLLTEQARAVATQSLEKYNRGKRMRENENETSNATPLPFAGVESNKRPRQRFGVPRFVESLGQGDPYLKLIGGRPPNVGSSRASGNNARRNIDFNSTQSRTQTTSPATSSVTNPVQLPHMTYNVSHSMAPMPPISFSEQTNSFNAQSGAPSFANNLSATNEQQSPDQFQGVDLGYEAFEQFFPPQTGMTNSLIFEDLLNFDFQVPES